MTALGDLDGDGVTDLPQLDRILMTPEALIAVQFIS